MFGFTFQDVARVFPEKNRVHLVRILAEMVNKGMLCKITRDNYHIIPINADPETYVPDGHQVAKYLMQNLEWIAEHERMMEELGTGISLLDPAVPDQGRKMKKFGLKINVDPIRIKMKVLDRKIS